MKRPAAAKPCDAPHVVANGDQNGDEKLMAREGAAKTGDGEADKEALAKTKKEKWVAETSFFNFSDEDFTARYEPSKHKTKGWVAAKHNVVARTRNRESSKTITMPNITYESSDKDFWAAFELAMDEAFSWFQSRGINVD